MALRDVLIDVGPLRRSPSFRVLYAATATSALGSRLTDIALPVQIYALTRSPLATGLLGLVLLGPHVVLGIIGGALADRHDKRTMMLVAEIGGGVTSVALLLNASAAHPRVGIVYALAFVASSFGAMASPASRSALPFVVDEADRISALALNSVLYSMAWLIGPAIFGVLAQLGSAPRQAYLLDAVSFAIGVVMLTRLRSIPPVESDDNSSGAGGLLRGAFAGLRLVRRNTVVLGSFLLDFDAMVFGFPTALLPAVVTERFHGRPLAYTVLYGAPFAGSLVASATSGWSRRVRAHGRAVICSIVVWGLAIAAFGMTHSLVISACFLTSAGAADMVSGVFRQAMLVDATPPKLRGRMEGTGMAVWASGPALGDIEAGVVARLTTVNTSIWSGGVVCAVGAVVIAALMPAVWRHRAAPTPAPAAAA